MHGRVKFRTSLEQEKIRQLEKQKKAAEFKKNLELVFIKKSKKEWDDEILFVTENILLQHPDIYTLWNIRREVFLNNNWFNEKRLERFNKELIIIEASLKESPKSYSLWHHRIWIIQRINDPNWKRELDLCNKCLDLDERNFHCWDYRLFIVQKAKIKDIEELQFTTAKILNNFSNYSSWHYRSKLLKKLYLNTVNGLTIRADKLCEELDLVMNATFTDPSDSSAWFYHRWLLNDLKFSIKLWQVILKERTVTITFYEKVESNFKLYCDNEENILKWKSINKKKISNVWYGRLRTSDFEKSNNIKLLFEGDFYQLKKLDSFNLWMYRREKLNKNHDDLRLKEQLNNYRTLHEMVPLNKWVKLTNIFLMLYLDPTVVYSNIVEIWNELMKVDPLRNDYYKDMRSKYILKYHLNYIENENTENNIISKMNLSNLKLTTLSCQESYLVFYSEINFSNNHLGNSLHQLYALQECVWLDLSNNAIISLKAFPVLRNLKFLILRNNQISNPKEVIELIRKLDIIELDIIRNPVDISLLTDEIQNYSKKIKVITEA